jgi:hypothetical protein
LARKIAVSKPGGSGASTAALELSVVSLAKKKVVSAAPDTPPTE